MSETSHERKLEDLKTIKTPQLHATSLHNILPNIKTIIKNKIPVLHSSHEILQILPE